MTTPLAIRPRPVQPIPESVVAADVIVDLGVGVWCPQCQVDAGVTCHQDTTLPSHKVRIEKAERAIDAIRDREMAEEAKERSAAQSRADKAKHAAKVSPTTCTCTNHMGTPKQKFKTREDALRVITRHHMWTHKRFRVYTCPRSGCFHVTGERAVR